jgi:hypothetical protein
MGQQQEHQPLALGRCQLCCSSSCCLMPGVHGLKACHTAPGVLCSMGSAALLGLAAAGGSCTACQALNSSSGSNSRMHANVCRVSCGGVAPG